MFTHTSRLGGSSASNLFLLFFDVCRSLAFLNNDCTHYKGFNYYQDNNDVKMTPNEILLTIVDR